MKIPKFAQSTRSRLVLMSCALAAACVYAWNLRSQNVALMADLTHAQESASTARKHAADAEAQLQPLQARLAEAKGQADKQQGTCSAALSAFAKQAASCDAIKKTLHIAEN